jgi:hypothetical protein
MQDARTVFFGAFNLEDGLACRQRTSIRLLTAATWIKGSLIQDDAALVGQDICDDCCKRFEIGIV